MKLNLSNRSISASICTYLNSLWTIKALYQFILICSRNLQGSSSNLLIFTRLSNPMWHIILVEIIYWHSSMYIINVKLYAKLIIISVKVLKRVLLRLWYSMLCINFINKKSNQAVSFEYYIRVWKCGASIQWLQPL